LIGIKPLASRIYLFENWKLYLIGKYSIVHSIYIGLAGMWPLASRISYSYLKQPCRQHKVYTDHSSRRFRLSSMELRYKQAHCTQKRFQLGTGHRSKKFQTQSFSSSTHIPVLRWKSGYRSRGLQDHEWGRLLLSVDSYSTFHRLRQSILVDIARSLLPLRVSDPLLYHKWQLHTSI
jgi:hypothetical protein